MTGNGHKSIVSIQQVRKIYRMGEVDVPALRETSLEIREGEFLVIAGPSGSGKSTLLNMIGGMDRPTDGRIMFEDRDLAVASERELTLYRRHQVGFVFQFYNLVPTLTALENIEVAVQVVRDPMDPMQALRLVGLEGRASHFPSQLSGGEQQRVAIARALAGNPRLLLCDEPTGALDIETGKLVLSLLTQLNLQLQKTLILITHNPTIALLGDRVARLRDGQVLSINPNTPPHTVDQLEW